MSQATEWDQAAAKSKEAAAKSKEALEKGKDAVGTVAEVAGHAASAVGTMASKAAGTVGRKADDLTAGAGAGIHGLGNTLERNLPHDGMLGSASQAVAGAVRDGGAYIEEAKLSGMTEDVTNLIRRYPVPAVLIAVGVGWMLSRVLRR